MLGLVCGVCMMATNSLDPFQEGQGSSQGAKAPGGSAQPIRRWTGPLSNLPQMSTKAAQKKQKLLKGPMVQEGKVTIEELGKSFDSCTDAQLFAEKYVKQKTEDGEEDEEAAKLAAATNTMNFWTGQIALHLPISNFKEQVIAKALVHYGTAVKYAKEMEVASDSEYAVEGKESLWIDGTPFTELYWYTVRILTPKTRQSSHRLRLMLA